MFRDEPTYKRLFFTVSVWQGKDKEGKTLYERIPCVQWGEHAERTFNTIKEGDPVEVNGRIRVRRTEDTTGKLKSSVQIEVQHVAWAPKSRAGNNNTETEDDNETTEDVPF